MELNSSDSVRLQSLNPEKTRAAYDISVMTTQICDEMASYVASNFAIAPNPELQQLREQLHTLSNFILTHGYLFDDAVSIAARDLHDFCLETLVGINSGNSDKVWANNHITVRGVEIRNGFWNKFNEQIPNFQSRLSDSLRTEMRSHKMQSHPTIPHSTTQTQIMDRLIFVSHKETDKGIAGKLVDFLLAALEIKDKEVICTSVPGHMLNYGITIPDQLRDGLITSAVLISLLTQDSIKATWVLFELGAAWGLKKLVIPILGPGLSFQDIPGPLSINPGVQIDDEHVSSRLMDAVEQIATALAINQKQGGKAQEKMKDFIEALASFKPHNSKEENVPLQEQDEPNTQALSLSEKAKELLLEVCQDEQGIVIHRMSMAGEQLETNNKEFGSNNMKEMAKWKAALKYLISNDLLEPRGKTGGVFQITATGYDLSERLSEH